MSFHFKNKEFKENDILNVAMALCLEWGNNWMKPVDERLTAIYPSINNDEAKKIDIFIRDAREDIFKMIERHYLKELSEEQLKLNIKGKYSFLNDDNYNRLYSQGMYYAWRDYGG